MRPKTKQDIENIRKSGKILASVLDLIGKNLHQGISGLDIDRMASDELRRLGGEPVFKGVPGPKGVQDFPNIICISVDDAVVHGIPNDQPFVDGQVVGFDFGVKYNGMITDAARTFIVGGVARTKNEQILVDATKRSLDKGIETVKSGAKTGDIAAAVQEILDNFNLGIVRDLVGHGVGDDLHEPPEIPNYGFKGIGKLLSSGMTIAIEPMATLGSWQVVLDPDGWTIRSRDGSIAAHFEDTILVTSDGYEILTRN
jgi:methionyl aminopeptidase